MNESFWTGKKVLLTGHTGFKGAWLSLWLSRLGAEVVGYSLQAPTEPSLYETAGVAQLVKTIEGDVRDLDHVQRVFKGERPEILFHLAAQALISVGYQQPVETYATNVMGTVNVLEAARRTDSLRSVIVVTSDKCYANHGEDRPLGEDDPMGGDDPYSSSKGCAEHVTEAYRRSYFHADPSDSPRLGLASVRAGNVIGGGDWATDRLIPDCVRSIAAGQALRIRCPDAVRPWQHVLDPLAGYIRLAQRLWKKPEAFSGAWNFGPPAGEKRPVRWLVATLLELWGVDVGWAAMKNRPYHETRSLRLDCGKARRRLGFLPRIGLETAVEWTVEWYKGFYAGFEARHAALAQIDRWMSLETQEDRLLTSATNRPGASEVSGHAL